MTARERTSTSAIDTYIAALAAQLTVEPAVRATILEEIRGHLEEAVAAEQARGVTDAEAEARAVAAFGSVAKTARSLNATLPIYWDRRRMAFGIISGALAIWLIWTLTTFPFLVQLAATHHLNLNPSDISGLTPADLLFSASPLSFGLFKVLATGNPWPVVLILALFGAIAFILGSRASQGWRAGLALGLGIFAGMPFLVPALFYNNSFVSPLASLPVIVPIWLLIPYAVFAAWLGARAARAWEARSLRRMPSPAHLTRAIGVSARGLSRVSTATLVGLVLLSALIGVNGWSLARAASTPPLAPVAQQLANAQRVLSFTIRQPHYLPAGTVLTSVGTAQAWCGQCAVSLEYRNPDGTWLALSEMPSRATVTPTATIAGSPGSPDSLDFQASRGSVGGYEPVWWLGGRTISEEQTNLLWEDGSLDYSLATSEHLSTDTLKQIALSLYG